MVKMFNYGQIHHFLQMQYKLNGYAPDSFINSIKTLVDPSFFEYGRFSGTMSNYMNLNVTGYNHNSLTQQINNKKNVSQPTISYIYPFIDLMKKLEVKNIFFTANIHKAYLENKVQDMYNTLDLVCKELNVIGIELGNECDMEGKISGSSTGTPNLLDKLKSFNFSNPSKIIEDNTKKYMDFCQQHSEIIKQNYNVKTGVTYANPSSIRGRSWNKIVTAYDFYDALIPHVYITADNDIMVKEKVDFLLKDLPTTKEKWVTETNWNYNEISKPTNNYHNTQFRTDLFNALESHNIDYVGFHTIWAGKNNANNWINI